MKFTEPAGTNPIDRMTVVGRAQDRIDGPRKTSGTAPYAYEHHAEAPNAAYGWIIGAAIAKGRIRSMNLDDARGAPGVLGIVTANEAGKLFGSMAHGHAAPAGIKQAMFDVVTKHFNGQLDTAKAPAELATAVAAAK